MRITERFNQWLENTPQPWLLGQVAILAGYELRHRDDLGLGSSEGLIPLDGLPALREMVKCESLGRFRPLRGAPTLRRGWQMGPLDVTALIDALNVVYPGAVGLWAAQQARTLAPTEFVGTSRRQTGMYRITQVVTQEQFERTVGEVCEAGCLRRRLWQPVSPGIVSGSSELPLLCPEPCNYLVAKVRDAIVTDREKVLPQAGVVAN